VKKKNLGKKKRRAIVLRTGKGVSMKWNRSWRRTIRALRDWGAPCQEDRLLEVQTEKKKVYFSPTDISQAPIGVEEGKG